MRKVALVTGSTGGIGVAIVKRLVRDGFSVAVTDLSVEAAAGLVSSLPGEGHKAWALDVSSESDVIAVFEQVESEMGPINVVVAAAGVLILDPNGQRRLIAETDFDDWDKTQTINSTGTFLLMREYLRLRTQSPLSHARFIALSSVAAQLGGYRSSSAYIASKSAVLGLVKAAAREGASLGVTVNGVAPGLIDAPMLRLSLNPEDDENIIGSIPLNRLGTPEDVAGAVAFLAGDDSAYITGSVVDVNGGYRMQ